VTTHELPASTRWSTIVVIWVLAAVAAVCIGLFAAVDQYSAFIALALAGCTIATLVIQLATREKSGFVGRLSLSVVGAFLVLAVASAILWTIAAVS
jgi:hypothetical protein